MKRTAVLVSTLACLIGAFGASSAEGTVIGPDNRTVVADTTTAPNRAIGQIQVVLAGQELNCSAFLIDRNTIVTAGHCLHTGGASGQFIESLSFHPGRSNGASPYGSCGWTSLYVGQRWAAASAANEDWGVVQLDCNIGDTTGWFRMKFLSDANLLGRNVTVRGVAADGKMKTAADKVRRVAARTVTHRADADGAQAGAPIFQASGCSGPCVLAIQTAGCGGACPAPNGNRGVRITLGLSETLTEIASENDPRPDGLIRLGNGPFIGNNEINGSGVRQGRNAFVRRGRSVTFTARFQSDGSEAVDLRLRGTGGTNRIQVKFFSGNTNITRAVRAGTYPIDDLAVGTHRDIRIVATVKNNAPLNQNVSITLKATSQSGARYRDLVRANVFPRA